MEKLESPKASQNPLFGEKGSSVEVDGRWKKKNRGKDDEADHRSKGQKFKRSKERETDHSPVVNTVRNTSKKVRYHSTSCQKDGFAENSPVNNPISSAEKRSVTRGVHLDSVSNNKDDVGNENERAVGIFVPSSSTNTESVSIPTKIAEILESAEGLGKMFPERPNFKALPPLSEMMEESLTYGLLLRFIVLVKDIKNLSANASDEEFAKKFKALDKFEEFGFRVEQIRDRLTKLREMRGAMTS